MSDYGNDLPCDQDKTQIKSNTFANERGMDPNDDEHF